MEEVAESILYPPFYRDQKEEFENAHLSPYAVKSITTERLYSKNYKKCKYRTEFQRDRDRIIHSRAFRRLTHKTQVYMALAGDHYRNRLSHSLELSQIAKSIATYLGLNVDLVEAIALGHDLGHTPFGHAVEGYLNKILQQEGGFYHNYQGLLVVDFLESSKLNETRHGINLTNHTRYGILRHTDVFPESGLYNTQEDNLICNTYKSIEAELVKVVDTLNYLCHDLEDAIEMGIFYDTKIHNKKLFDRFWDEEIVRINDKIIEILEIDKKDFPVVETDLSNYPKDLLLKALIEDLVRGTSKTLKDNNISTIERVKNYEEDIVQFDLFKEDFKRMKRILRMFVYWSPMAQQMDSKAKHITRYLLKSFRDNHKQLPHSTRINLERLKNETYSDRLDSGYKLTEKRILCNYISGMTDRYALENYKTMFGTEY